MTMRFHAACGLLASIVVVGAIAWGFVVVGGPSTRRLERFDEQRLQDLQAIARELHDMVVDPNDQAVLKDKLPDSLEEATRRARVERINPFDPETGEPYGYTVKSETTFELCATFALPRESDANVFWNHSPGTHCFTINVLDPPQD